MTSQTVKKNYIFYFVTCVAVLVLNFLYRSGDSSLLTWILAPTAWWVGVLGGVSFEPLPGRGYVNETFRFLIAPSCSGIRFLQIVLLMLVFSHTHRVREGGKKLLWLPFCFSFSYLSTVMVNGIRIILSIYLPVLLEKAEVSIAGLTPERLHILIGTFVYFSFLLLLQPAATMLTDRFFAGTYVGDSAADEQRAVSLCRSRHSVLFAPAVPVFWYFLAVLAIPFVKRLITGDLKGFGQYAMPIILTCLGIGICLAAVRCLWHRQ